MLRSSLLFCALVLPLAGHAETPRQAGISGGSYAHALQMEARREAFWRHHGGLAARAETPEVSLRKANYWQAQGRSRALCQASGSCM